MSARDVGVIEMTSNGNRIRRRRGSAAAEWFCLGLCVMLAHSAIAQDAQPPATGTISPQSLPVTPATEPGVITEIGRWLKSATSLGAAQDAAKGAASATMDAATSMIRLPGTRVVAGRQRCERAPNGGPDCQAAANVICVGKGFRTGRSLDMQSEENCPASAWLSGRTETACPTEHFVTRAVCQ